MPVAVSTPMGTFTGTAIPMLGPDEGMPPHLPQGHELQLNHECSLTFSETRPSANQAPPSRRFDPAHHYPGEQTFGSVQIRKGQFVFLACPTTPPCIDCGHLVPHVECPVISIHGACSNDGTTEARCAIGLWIGESNPNNLFLPLDRLPRHTGQVAELYAVISALGYAEHNLDKWKRVRSRPFIPSRLHTIVIKTDSPNVVNGITEWLARWKSNGWKRGKGQAISNDECWKIIDRLLENLETHICVKFWLVSREENDMAVSLAQNALKRPPSSEFQNLTTRWAEST